MTETSARCRLCVEEEEEEEKEEEEEEEKEKEKEEEERVTLSEPSPISTALPCQRKALIHRPPFFSSLIPAFR